jgi:CBS domain-containing protein
MRIADILAGKGRDVVTVAPTDTVTTLLAALAERNVGACVVVDDSGIAGIVSERDVVRALHQRGAHALGVPISEIMTAMVATCGPDDRVEHLSVTMTEKRIRHIPVLDADGALAGIVSIGDVVKSRIDQLEVHREQLEAYISG